MVFSTTRNAPLVSGVAVPTDEMPSTEAAKLTTKTPPDNDADTGGPGRDGVFQGGASRQRSVERLGSAALMSSYSIADRGVRFIRKISGSDRGTRRP
jgi:hypothetical protein